ncbi:hypothetical protein TSOC111612_23970 [Tsukamurella ocularis]
MRDGIDLIADRYVPTGQALGTVLVRSPYGRRPPYSNLYAHVFAERGYQVVMQSCRGTFGSGGVAPEISAEPNDAQDTVAWLREQPWFTGTFATVGMSYLGWTQWALLADAPEELVASIIIVGPNDAGRLFRSTGALALQSAVFWANAVSTQEQHGWFTSLVIGALTGKRRTTAAIDGVPLIDTAEKVFGKAAPYFREWAEHEDITDAYWATNRVPVSESNVPTLLTGGWQDAFLEQTIDQYRELKTLGADVALTVGPWTHVETMINAGDIVTREALDWLDTHLARRNQTGGRAAARIFVTGTDEWRDLTSWPPATSDQHWHLRSGGRLTRDEPSSPEPSSTFRYDPHDPTPSIGGRTLDAQAGRRDNRSREERDDVLTFTSAPLTGALEVAGIPTIELQHQSDNPFSDISVRICEVDAQGVSTAIADAYLRLRESHSVITLNADPLHHVFSAGSRIRVQLAGGAYPQYDRNLGTGDPVATGTSMRSSDHRIPHGPVTPARITLPVVG